MTKIGHNGGPPIDWKQYGGFIVEARTTRDHPIVGYGKQVKPADETRGFCFSVNEAWRFLLHECQYKDGRVNNGGRMMEIRRGELTGAVSWLGHVWNWTPKTVRRFLDRLEADGMIARFTTGPDGSRVGTERGNHGGKQAAIISVCNYDKFNIPQAEEGQANGQAEGKQGASKGQAEGKSINKETIKQESIGDARAPLLVQPKDGEEVLAHGVLVNCATVRHPAFSISVEAIAMQLATASGLGLTVDEARQYAKEAALSHALQWAAEIENGKLSHDVVPKHPANFIRGSVASQLSKQTYGKRALKPGEVVESPSERRARLARSIVADQSKPRGGR